MIEVSQEIKDVTITVEQSGLSTTIQPTLIKSESISIDGGTP